MRGLTWSGPIKQYPLPPCPVTWGIPVKYSNHFPCCRPFSTWYGQDTLTSMRDALQGPKFLTIYLWMTRLPISSSYFLCNYKILIDLNKNTNKLLTIAASPLISPPYLTCCSSELPLSSNSAFRITSAFKVTKSSVSDLSVLVLKGNNRSLELRALL